MAAACPRCGATAVENDKCAQCGVVASMYAAALQKMRRPPAPVPAASRTAAPETRPVAAPMAAPQTASTANGSSKPPMAVSPTAVTAAARVRQLTFHGLAGSLFGIYVVNVLLTIATLGFYRFWGKVRVRSFMLSQTSFEGDRFAYHGTGKELLLGFLKVVVFVGAPITALSFAAEISQNQMVALATQGFISILVFLFLPVAMVGARRYRLSRMSWRGIRFSFRGRARDFVKIFVTGAILTVLTLTLYYPFFLVRQQRFMVAHSHFGRRGFVFNGRGRDLLGAYALAVLLFPVTLGLAWFWFQAKQTRYFWEHTAFETARFRATVTGRQLMNLTLSNFLVLLITLGLAWPWVVVRNTRFVFSYLTVEGPLDLDGIVQEPQPATATGDALSSLLGADVGIA
jgi:uncharacterized membrane protein YjgN (DUF898 family)